jgi:hypothetical protein
MCVGRRVFDAVYSFWYKRMNDVIVRYASFASRMRKTLQVRQAPKRL